MRFLVIGLGSMGKRRIRCLMHLGEKDITGFDIRKDRRKETEKQHGIRTFDMFEEAMDAEPDVFIISTPPDKHLEYQAKAVEYKKHFFCESGIFLEKLDWIINESKQRGVIAAPSQTMRFYPAVKMIKQFLDNGKIGKPISFNYHCGNYLPNWHSWENIHDFYVSKRMTGGAREMVGPDLTLCEGTELEGTNPPDYFFHKAGMINLTRFFASLYGKCNIRVNSVSPGGLFNNQPEKFVKRYKRRTFLGRMANKDDIKGIVVFLASDASSYITGTNIVMDGGYTAK